MEEECVHEVQGKRSAAREDRVEREFEELERVEVHAEIEDHEKRGDERRRKAIELGMRIRLSQFRVDLRLKPVKTRVLKTDFGETSDDEKEKR